MISDHTHSCPDVTDDNGETPLDLATVRSTNTFLDQDERKRYTEVVDYLKSLSTEHSESLLQHTLCPHITKVEWLLCDQFITAVSHIVTSQLFPHYCSDLLKCGCCGISSQECKGHDVFVYIRC